MATKYYFEDAHGLRLSRVNFWREVGDMKSSGSTGPTQPTNFPLASCLNLTLTLPSSRHLANQIHFLY